MATRSVKTILQLEAPWLRKTTILQMQVRNLLKVLWNTDGCENGVVDPSAHPIAMCCPWGCRSVTYERYFVHESEIGLVSSERRH